MVITIITEVKIYSRKPIPWNRLDENCHFVTSDILYFLIAENRLFRTEGQVEQKERILKASIGSFSARCNDFYRNIYKFQKRISRDLKGLLKQISQFLANVWKASAESAHYLLSASELFALK